MVALKPPIAEPLDAQAVDGEVVVLAHDGPTAMALTPEAAIKTAQLLKAAGIAALEQKGYRRKKPPAPIPRPTPDQRR